MGALSIHYIIYNSVADQLWQSLEEGAGKGGSECGPVGSVVELRPLAVLPCLHGARLESFL